jgi:hypothetical protein
MFKGTLCHFDVKSRLFHTIFYEKIEQFMFLMDRSMKKMEISMIWADRSMFLMNRCIFRMENSMIPIQRFMLGCVTVTVV